MKTAGSLRMYSTSPRLDDDAEESYARTQLSVVVDENNTVQTVRAPLTFETPGLSSDSTPPPVCHYGN